MKIFLITLYIFLICGCAQNKNIIRSDTLRKTTTNYYYVKIGEYPYGAPIELKNRITKSEYRILPSDIQSAYERVDGDECDEIHCPQF